MDTKNTDYFYDRGISDRIFDISMLEHSVVTCRSDSYYIEKGTVQYYLVKAQVLNIICKYKSLSMRTKSM